MPKESVTILGIHDGHNSGVALVRDGRVLAAISEERCNNIKNYSGVPKYSIREVFRVSEIDPHETTAIAIVGLLRSTAPQVEEETLKVKLYRKFGPILKGHKLTNFYVRILHKTRNMKELKKIFKTLNIQEKPIFFVEHHLAHAASAFYQKPWKDNTLILTLDGAGDGLCSTVSIGNEEGITRIASTTSYHSIANNMYSEITGYLGLKRWEHEYKIMGMAPYGHHEYAIEYFRKFFAINPKNKLEFQNKLGGMGRDLQPKFRRIFAEQRFDNLASACQLHFEDLVKKWVLNAIKDFNLHKLVFAGGAMLNVKANKELRELEQIDESFFYPVCDDNGTPIGAALYIYFKLMNVDGKKPVFYPLKELYLGREFNDQAILKAIEKSSSKVKYTYIDQIEDEIALRLANDEIIARFDGKEEFGPRALGNRSIVAKADDLITIRKINFAIKQRDFWMPFAPSILEADMDRYLVDPKPARYMIEAFSTKSEANEIVASLHPFDNTARPQTVNDWNKNWLSLLLTFKELTGFSGFLNTSFNLHGFPIVGTPEIAIETFLNSGLDYLAIGNYSVRKN